MGRKPHTPLSCAAICDTPRSPFFGVVMKKNTSLPLYSAITLLSAAILPACHTACPTTTPCPAAEACDACKAVAAEEIITNTQNDNAKMKNTPAQTQKIGVLSRDQIDPKFLWKKDRLFPSQDAFHAALLSISDDIAQIKNCPAFDSAENLLTCLDRYFVVHTNVNKLTLYANMVADTQPSSQASADQTKAQAALAQLMDNAKIIRENLLKIAPNTLDQFFNTNPELKKHESYIRNITRRANRVLSPDAERVLSLAGDNLWAEIDLNEIHSISEDVFDAMLSSMNLPVITDENKQPVQLTLSNYAKYRKSPDRNIRKAAVAGLMNTLKQYEDVFANAYLGQLKNDVLFAQARNYPTALEAYLDKDDIPVDIYKNLLDTIGKNLAPLHRYVALRKKILGLDSLSLYDMYISLSDDVEKTYTYDDAVSLITTALAPLGDDYIKRLRAEMDPEKGSIDLLPYANKTSGAYSCSVFGIDPFILMNYQNTLDDVSTLAHELGHSMHSIYAMENQPAGAYHYTMFLAEIASTTNESILNDYLYKNAQSDQEKISLLVDKLENIRGTIYRQSLFAEFEYLAHTAVEQGTPVNADWLSQTYADLLKKYYGPDYTIGENEQLEWAYIPHFYYKYYVYSYATGLSSALSFAKLIESSPENAARYIDMLKAGSADDSITLLKNAGVDLNTPQPIQFALDTFDQTLTELEKLLAK